MQPITAVLSYSADLTTQALLEEAPAVAKIILCAGPDGPPSIPESVRDRVQAVEAGLLSGSGMAQVIAAVETDYLLVILPGEPVRLGQRALERLLAVAEDTGAGLVYADFRDELNGELSDHPLIDYQPGSIRDTFDFGPVLLISRRAAEQVLAAYGPINQVLNYAGLYDLRLKLSVGFPIMRVPEPLYTRTPLDRRLSGERQFDYVDPRRRDYQIEMEQVATEHLKRIGALLTSEFMHRPRIGAMMESGYPPRVEQQFPVRASVVIPVRNRERTVRDAALSALSQFADFPFNVIAVDNHSTDRTTAILAELAGQHANLIHLRPSRTDLGIGGCWNEAIYSADCGEYAVQLDSDDLYADEHTLARVVAKFDEGPYGMVIGAYTIVNFDLQEIPPGLIDHREWTRDNGRNNALRINGLGAPRAFYVPLLRQTGLPNVSYGEDYAVALRLSRHYEIGRIYDSIYLARRWEGNSDAALPLATANRYDAYKDYLRTVEIRARQRMNQA